MAWFCYLLECADGTLYTGISNDLPRRLGQHARGVASKYTRARLPVRLRWTERQRDRSSALRREAQIKGLSRSEKLALRRRATQRRRNS
jgi:putative endonuclease